MRKTKIICTIGPASENKETLIAMCKAGMNVARLNFSHGTYPEQQSKIDLIKQVRQELGLPIAIMLDTKGPEYRIRTFESGRITLNEGDDFIFTTDEVEGDRHRVSVNYKHLTENLKPGDRIGRLKDELPAVKHASERYLFMPENATVLQVRAEFENRSARNCRQSSVFITPTGICGEPLLAMLTPWDVLGETSISE